jgi:hypothetical protein
VCAAKLRELPSPVRDVSHFRYDAHEIIDAGDTIIVPVKTDALSVRGIRMQNEHLFLFKEKEGRTFIHESWRKK